MHQLSLLLVVGLALLAGCVDREFHPPPPDGDTYALRLVDAPASVPANTTFNLTVEINMADGKPLQLELTDHIGAHAWATAQADPTAAFSQSTPCVHSAGYLPGQYLAACTAPASGTLHVRAHARLTRDDGVTVHWWGADQAILLA